MAVFLATNLTRGSNADYENLLSLWGRLKSPAHFAAKVSSRFIKPDTE